MEFTQSDREPDAIWRKKTSGGPGYLYDSGDQRGKKLMRDKKIIDLDKLLIAKSADNFLIFDKTSKRITVVDLMTSPGPIGTTTPSLGEFSILKLTTKITINEFSVDGTLEGNSDTTIPTEKAVKTYVDTILAPLIDNSIANALHRHSELVASDGSPDHALSIDANGSLLLTNGTSINEFSIDGTLGGDSDNAVPTEKAVKSYVDHAIANIT